MSEYEPISDVDRINLEHRLTLFQAGLAQQVTALHTLTLAVDTWAALQREQNGNVARIMAKHAEHLKDHELLTSRGSAILALLRAQWQALVIAGAALVWTLQNLGVL